MKTLKFGLLAAALVLTASCAKEKQAQPLVAPAGVTPDVSCRGGCPPMTGGDTTLPDAPAGTGEDPTKTGYDSGSTAALELAGGTSTLSQMFYNSVPNSPKNVRINIDFRRQVDAVIVSYVDNGRVVEAGFGTVHPYSGVSNAKFNGWVNQDGKNVWKGFFQDQYGAVVLILDRFLSQGDGQPAKILGGSLWFQNFNRYAPNAPLQGNLKMCWEISLGPYDCRTFLVGNNVQMTSSQYPNNKGPNANMHYQKLGDFDGIAASAAGL